MYGTTLPTSGVIKNLLLEGYVLLLWALGNASISSWKQKKEELEETDEIKNDTRHNVGVNCYYFIIWKKRILVDTYKLFLWGNNLINNNTFL